MSAKLSYRSYCGVVGLLTLRARNALTVLKRILIDHWKMRETEAWLNMARLPMKQSGWYAK
jgi:hypothetical protein